MGKYIVKQNNVTPTAGNDIITCISGSGRRIRVVEVSVNGRGTTSAAQQIEVSRNATGTTPGGAVTPTKFDNSDQPAANFTTATTWSVQPSIDVNAEPIGFNALGGANRWTPPKGVAWEARNGEVISIRATTGVTFQALTLGVVIEED